MNQEKTEVNDFPMDFCAKIALMKYVGFFRLVSVEIVWCFSSPYRWLTQKFLLKNWTMIMYVNEKKKNTLVLSITWFDSRRVTYTHIYIYTEVCVSVCVYATVYMASVYGEGSFTFSHGKAFILTFVSLHCRRSDSHDENQTKINSNGLNSSSSFFKFNFILFLLFFI